MYLYRFVYQQKRIDLTVPSNTIRTFICGNCRNIIINHQKRYVMNTAGMVPGRGRGGLRGPCKKGEVRITAPRPDIVPIEHYAALSRAMKEDIELPFPLALYAEYYDHHGTLVGAAIAIEEAHGFCRKKVEAAFKRVCEQMKRNNL